MEPTRNFKFHGLESGMLTGVSEKPKKIGNPANETAMPTPTRPIQSPPAFNQPGSVQTQSMAEIMKMFGQITSDLDVVKNHVTVLSNSVTSEPDAVDETNKYRYHFVEGYVIIEDLPINVYRIAGFPNDDFPMDKYDIDDVIDWLEENQPELDNSGSDVAARAIECKTDDLLEQIDDLIAITGTYGLDDDVFDEFKHAVNNMCTFRPIGAGSSESAAEEIPDENSDGEELETEAVEDAEEASSDIPNADGEVQKKSGSGDEADVNIDDLPDVDGSDADSGAGSNLQNYTREINDKVPDSAVANLVAGTRRNGKRDRRVQEGYYPGLVEDDD